VDPAASNPEEQRDETPVERLDRNTIELLQELRVAGAGIQIIFGFLLVAPFDNRFKDLSSFGRTDYFVTLVCVAAAAVLLMAPTIQHRLLFRHAEKPYLVFMGNRLAIIGMVFLSFGFTGILVLVSDFVVGGAAPVIVGVLTGVVIGGLWFAMPLARRRGGEAE
jgi:hypothetical protein